MDAEARPKFAREQPFRHLVQERVEAYFASAGVANTGGRAILVKTLVMLSWLLLSYLLLLFVADSLWQATLAATSLALAIAGTGMAIHHDANHGAYSERKWVNNLFKRTLDLLGVSSYMWGWTHNVFHHTYTNIDGVDQDVDLGAVARLAPSQQRRWFHAYQHWYMWVVYGFTFFYFVFAEDFIQLRRTRVGPHRFPTPRGLELIGVFASKLFVFGWMLGVPLLFHDWHLVVIVFGLVWFVSGFFLGLTFQVAHLVPEATFPQVTEEAPQVASEWAIHQVKNTADFAPRNRFITWYVGGLNYQIEHHLFPKISHIHYPKIAPLVQQACAEFGLPYTVYPGAAAAVHAHYQWLARMGARKNAPLQ